MPEINDSDDIEGVAREMEVKPRIRKVKLKDKEIITEENDRAPELKFIVYGQCKDTDGLKIGLSEKQMLSLGVKEGDYVRISAGGKSAGVFTVCLESNKITRDPSVCTANLPRHLDKGPITVQRFTDYEQIRKNLINFADHWLRISENI